MKNEDVPQVVTVHRASFPGFFLSELGPRFLAHYYGAVCSAPEGIALVSAGNGDDVEGFVAGTSNPKGFYKRLLKRDWLKFSLASVGPILRRPRIVFRIARAVRHPGENPAGEDVAGLFSLGIDPAHQGKGLGRELVRRFLEEAKKRGCRRVFLTTDRDGNEGVNHFYKKLGFEVEREFSTPQGRRMNEYWIDL